MPEATVNIYSHSRRPKDDISGPSSKCGDRWHINSISKAPSMKGLAKNEFGSGIALA